MFSSDSMFQFELIVKNVVCFVKCKKFFIRSDFHDVFSMYLKNPNESSKPERQPRSNGKRLKTIKAKTNKFTEKIIPYELDLDCDSTVTFSSSIEMLRDNMRTFPLELTIITQQYKTVQTGSIQIPWKQIYFNFLDQLQLKGVPREISEKGQYHLYHDVTSKRVATLSIQLKLSYINDVKIDMNKFIYPNSKGRSFKRLENEDLNYNPGTIRTRYRGRGLDQYIRHKKKHLRNDNEEDSDKIPENVKGSIVSESTSIIADDILSNYFLNYDDGTSYRNQLYCVGYCTVENDFGKDAKGSSAGSSKQAISNVSVDKDTPVENYKLQLCDNECPSKRDDSCPQSVSSIDLPESARKLITVKKCKDVTCDDKKYRKLPTPVDSMILIDLHKNPCCQPIDDTIQKMEEIVIGGTMTARMNMSEDPCYCACECTFGFVKNTTYCAVCGGYERKGEDLAGVLVNSMPHPCPLYHKLMDKSKSKTLISPSGSGSKKSVKAERTKSPTSTQKENEVKDSRSAKEIDKKAQKGKGMDKKAQNIKDDEKKEPEKDGKGIKKGKSNKDDKFKFNYGYQGIPPQIGHSQCGLPIEGALVGRNVPTSMGWLWTAENVPGMKFRPGWKPGASNKHVVRLLKCARNPGEAMNKKKRKKEGSKRRKNEKRPLLVVHKKDGEFNITMETMKLYPKVRTINQYPYEDKPVLTYTIGRTDEENRERQRKKERAQRRLERAQREFIQSSFKNMCEDICVKTYQQALGILPGTEDPDCPCFPALPDPEKMDLDRSCSCSEDKVSRDTETDSDEWIVEFTPPNAKFNSTFKPKRIFKVDNSSQYNYLDYRVKLLDKSGNQVPRFFKGPDGKEQCSDLGGFWSPDKTWLDINIDGYIAPDGRWAPITFIGPGDETIECDNGKFQIANGNWLVVGEDGYIDAQGRWKFYSRRNKALTKPSKTAKVAQPKGKGGAGDLKDGKDKKGEKGPTKQQSVATWSCFGDNISPKYLSEMGIIGHGHDKDILNKTLTELIARGDKVTIPQIKAVPRLSPSRQNKQRNVSRMFLENRTKCHHALPSDKGVIAVDDEGNKTYFKLSRYKNKRPKERVHTLHGQGINVSSFHIPCLESFINSEIMKQQQRDRIFALAKHVATQAQAGDIRQGILASHNYS